MGLPVDIDDLTLQKNREQFARVQVLVDIKEEVTEKVKYVDENGRLCEQELHYEWLPVVCKNCKAYGHLGKDCRKQKPQVWALKKKTNEPQVDDEGWKTVTSRRDKGKKSVQSIAAMTVGQNESAVVGNDQSIGIEIQGSTVDLQAKPWRMRVTGRLRVN